MKKILQDVSLGNNLKRYRKEMKLSQQDICAQMGFLGRPMGQTTYSQIETGQRNIFVSDLIVLSEVLNVDFNALFKGIKPIKK